MVWAPSIFQEFEGSKTVYTEKNMPTLKRNKLISRYLKLFYGAT